MTSARRRPGYDRPVPELTDIAVIGGSGFYDYLEDAETLAVDTPFGEPSAPLTLGRVGDRRVAFLPRHGARHQHPPHRVNYRANLWALRSVGVRQVVAPSAVGSLRPELVPGTFVVPDQLVDRTWGRGHTYYDDTGSVVHVSFATPYCPRGRATVLHAGGHQVVDGGTLVVVNGPRFSTAAESTWHAAQGWSVVGMTGQPEASLARELALCYTPLTMVTDHDAGAADRGAVSHAEVLRVVEHNVERLRQLLGQVIARLPAPQTDAEADCGCRRALDGLTLPCPLP